MDNQTDSTLIQEDENFLRVQHIGSIIAKAFNTVALIKDCNDKAKVGYKIVDDYIDSIYTRMKVLMDWAEQSIELKRQHISKDEASLLVNAIIYINGMLPNGFYVNAAFTIMGQGAADDKSYSYRVVASTIQDDFQDMFDIMDLLEDFT